MGAPYHVRLARPALPATILLAATAPDALGLAVATVGSFGILYGQLVSPSPSGAGAFEYLRLHRIAGHLSPDAPWVLLWWRVFTTFAAALAGAPFLARALRARLRRPREPGRRAS